MRTCLLTLLLLAGGLMAAEQPTIATLDLERFLENAKLFTTRSQKLQESLANFNERFQGEGEAITKLETRLSMTERSDPKYNELVLDIEAKKTRIKLAQKQAQSELEQRKAKLLETSITEALDIVEHYSNEKGIELVLRTSANAEQGKEEMIPELQVLYRSPTLNITDALIAYANARFVPEATPTVEAPTGPAPLIEALPENSP
jgi:Skp family chaperone for outer membrane proteins